MQWLLLGMIVVMPFEKNPYLSLGDSFLGIFPGFTLIKLLGLVGIALVLWRVLTGQIRVGLWDSRSSKAFLVFLGLVAFAAFMNGASPRAITRYVSVALFLPIMLVAIESENDFRKALWGCTGIMIVCLPYAYRQFLRFGGRLGVGLYEPNYFALALVLLIPLAFVIARQQASMGQRIFWFTGFGGLVVSMILTGSRGGFLGTLLCTGILSFRMARHRWIVPGLIAVGLLVAVFVFPTSMGQRLQATISHSGVRHTAAEASTQAHIELFYSGIRMIADNPIFGVGLGKFKEMSGVYYDVIKERIAHNTFIHIGAESGLPSLIAFAVLLFFVFLSLHSSGRLALVLDQPHVYEWTVAMQAGLTGYLLSACFVSAQFEKFFWVVVFLSIALERVLVIQLIEQESGMTATSSTQEEDIPELLAWTRYY